MTDIITIDDINNYNLEFNDGKLILTPKYTKVTPEELCGINLAHSIINKCIIYNDDKIISTSTKYRSMLIDIWKNMPSQLLLTNTTYNMKLSNENDNGYKWIDCINLSVQDKDSNGAFKELLKMVEINQYKFTINITLFPNKKILVEYT